MILFHKQEKNFKMEPIFQLYFFQQPLQIVQSKDSLPEVIRKHHEKGKKDFPGFYYVTSFDYYAFSLQTLQNHL